GFVMKGVKDFYRTFLGIISGSSVLISIIHSHFLQSSNFPIANRKSQILNHSVFLALNIISASMTISYNWLSDYLPVKVEPERLSKILTAIGLEVESLEKCAFNGSGEYEDTIFEIGLTPNRMDAMSHI